MKPSRLVSRMRDFLFVIKQYGLVVLEKSTIIARLTFGPCKVDQQGPIRTEVTTAVINPAMKPLANLEGVRFSVPLDELDPV